MSRPKLDVETVLAIRTSSASDRTLARELGVGRKTVGFARRGLTYKYIDSMQDYVDIAAQAIARKRAGRPKVAIRPSP